MQKGGHHHENRADHIHAATCERTVWCPVEIWGHWKACGPAARGSGWARVLPKTGTHGMTRSLTLECPVRKVPVDRTPAYAVGRPPRATRVPQTFQ